MRLTLRTLLAYLDKVLEPSDAKDLQEKVTQGRLARGMVDRIQSVVKRPKLAAPKIDARGTAGDANIVAEYLDNTLPAQHVADFEQVCLAEDARLAEVASCHQILTMVLAKPAIISHSLRNRICELGSTEVVSSVATDGKVKRGSGVLESLRDSVIERNGKRFRVDSAHRAMDPARDELLPDQPRPIATAGLELDDKLISHVPEYLKSGKSGDWSNAFIILGLLAALFFVVWLSVGSLDDIQGLLHQNTNVARSSSNEATTQQPSHVAESNAAEESKLMTSNTAPPGVPSNVAEVPRDAVNITESNAIPPELPPDTGSEPANPFQPTSEKGGSTPEKTSSEEPPVVLKAPSDVNEGSGIQTIQWLPDTKESTTALVFAKRESQESPPTIRRLANGESLMPFEQLVVPPTYRTEFKITPGIRWIVADETVLKPMSTKDTNSAAVELRLGRALVHSTPDCLKIFLQTPVHSVSILMKDASSIVAVELRYRRIVGRTVEHAIENLRTESIGMMRPFLSLVCVAGETTLEFPNEDPLSLEVGQGFEWSTDGPARSIKIKDIPWWYRDNFQRPIDAEASQDLATRLTIGANADIKNVKSAMDLLRDSTESRRNETASLAIRTMSLLGEYSKCFGTDGILSSPSSRPHRTVILETVYQSLGVSPQHLTALKEAIDSTDLPRAPRLLGLLCLPDDTQLADGVDRSLVESLGSPFLDERVLGIYQLHLILGKDHGFQSDRPNMESLQQWKRLLNSAKIRWPK